MVWAASVAPVVLMQCFVSGRCGCKECDGAVAQLGQHCCGRHLFEPHAFCSCRVELPRISIPLAMSPPKRIGAASSEDPGHLLL